MVAEVNHPTTDAAYKNIMDAFTERLARNVKQELAAGMSHSGNDFAGIKAGLASIKIDTQREI